MLTQLIPPTTTQTTPGRFRANAGPRKRSRLTPDYEFDDRLGGTGRYVDKRSGRIVSQRIVDASLRRVQKAARDEMRETGRRLVTGETDLKTFVSDMRRLVKIVHGAAAAVNGGGWAKMSQSDWGFIGSLVKTQLNYLHNFGKQIAEGLKLDGRVLRRASMYADAAKGTAEEAKRRFAKARGRTRERRVLGEAEHCPDCLEYAARGWQPIGTLPKIGQSVCRTNCQCEFEFE